MKNANWPWLHLGELFEIGAGKTMSRAAREGRGKIPFLRTSNVLWDEIDLSHLDEMAMTPQELQEKCVENGDLLVCEGGEIGRAAIWNSDRAPIAFQNHLHRLRPRVEGIQPRFYVYFLQSAFTQLGIYEGSGNKTTIPNLSRNRLAAFEVPRPPKAEQEAIARSLSLVREALQGHTRSVGLAVEIKRAAMLELFARGLRGEPQKETEIGPLPESWPLEPIGMLFSIVQGLSLKGNLSRDCSGTPFMRTSNVYWGRVDLSSVSRMHIDPSMVGDKTLTAGDLLVCEGGEIGRAAIWEGHIKHCSFQNHLYRLRPPIIGHVEPKFALAWLEVGFCHRRVYEGVGNKTTIPNLSLSRLAETRMPAPSIDEQREIVTILDAIDRKIDLHRRKHALLEELFMSLLHKLMTADVRISDLDLSALPAPAEATP